MAELHCHCRLHCHCNYKCKLSNKTNSFFTNFRLEEWLHLLANEMTFLWWHWWRLISLITIRRHRHKCHNDNDNDNDNILIQWYNDVSVSGLILCCAAAVPVQVTRRPVARQPAAFASLKHPCPPGLWPVSHRARNESYGDGRLGPVVASVLLGSALGLLMLGHLETGPKTKLVIKSLKMITHQHYKSTIM